MNSFQQMFAAQDGRANGAQNQVDENNGTRSSHRPAIHDTGIYEGDGGGLLRIDDDINPGLLSGIPPMTTMMVHWAARFTLHETLPKGTVMRHRHTRGISHR